MKIIHDKLMLEQVKKGRRLNYKNYCELKLYGGIDHIVITKNQIKVYDIGCNGKSNDWIIRR